LRVGVITDVYAVGGLETHIDTFLKYTSILFPDRELVYVSNFRRKPYFNGVNLVAELRDIKKDADLYFRQRLELEAVNDIKGLDVVIAHPFTALFSAYSFSVINRVPMIGVIHGKISLEFPSSGLDFIFNRFIKPQIPIFSVNLSISKKNNFIWLPNPIDESFWSPSDLSDDGYVLIVSRLDADKYKGIRTVLEDFSKEVDTRKVIVVGGGKYLEELKSEFPWVEFKGEGSSGEVRDLMRRASLVVGMGRVVLEALFMKKATMLLNYEGNYSLIDSEEKFEAYEVFNFNGTNLTSKEKLDKDFWAKVRSINNKFELEGLKRYKASRVVGSFWEFVDNWIRDGQFKYFRDQDSACLMDSVFKDLYEFESHYSYLQALHEEEKTKAFFLEEEVRKLKNVVSLLSESKRKLINEYKRDLEAKEALISSLNCQLSSERSEKDKLYESLKYIESSKSWKLVKNYWRLKGKIKSIFKFKRDKSSQTLRKEEVRSLILESESGFWVVNHPLVDWHIPLFQRPHHIAINLAKLGSVYFYSTTNTYDNVKGIEKVAERCYLIDDFSLVDRLNVRKLKKVYHIHAADHNVDIRFIEERLKKGYLVLYEYMDELHEDLSGPRVKKILERHRWVLENENVMVVSTAKKLFEEVSQYRSKNHILVTNGVDIDHFNVDGSFIPMEIKEDVLSGRPIIGYFGALAKWFDYSLVKAVAERNKDWIFLLIGWDYDGSLRNSGILELDNVKVIGPIPYASLPNYAIHFTVATIPFVINDITLATSPIKLFEYFALRKPVISTPLPEVLQFPEVLVGNTPEEFEALIEKGLELSEDEAYKDRLFEIAKQHSWLEKAKEIYSLILSNVQ